MYGIVSEMGQFDSMIIIMNETLDSFVFKLSMFLRALSREVVVNETK